MGKADFLISVILMILEKKGILSTRELEKLSLYMQKIDGVKFEEALTGIYELITESENQIQRVNQLEKRVRELEEDIEFRKTLEMEQNEY